MTRSGHLTRLCVLAWALSAGAGVLAAQSSDTLFATGVRAYKNLEFDLAAWLLRRGCIGGAGTPPSPCSGAS